MDADPRRPDYACQELSRVLLLWQTPRRFRVGERQAQEEVREWARHQASRLIRSGAVRAVELARLERASELHPVWFDWLLTAHVTGEPPSLRALDELTEDLESLNARPVLVRDAERWRF
jgi:DNA transposition AAA+ family ATPase